MDPFLADPKAFPLSLTEPLESFVKEKCPEGNVAPTPFGGLFLNITFGAHRHCSQSSRAGKDLPGAGFYPSKGFKEFHSSL